MRGTQHTQYAAPPCGNNSDYVPIMQAPRLSGQPSDGKIHSVHSRDVNHNRYAAGYENASDVVSHSQGVAIFEGSACAARWHNRRCGMSDAEGFGEHAQGDRGHQCREDLLQSGRRDVRCQGAPEQHADDAANHEHPP